MTPKTVAKLLKRGIPVDNDGKFVKQGLLDKSARVPILVILLQSQDLSEEEMVTLEKFRYEKIRKFKPQYVSENSYLAQGANTITFWKCDGYWKVHRLNWGNNAWIQVHGSLFKVISAL